MAELPSPCAGLRVIEFATMVSGPYGGQLLGDLGAEVIKVEPILGDPLRNIRPIHGGMSSTFLQFNRNKKSIAINLKTPEGAAIAKQLALSADVLLENNRNGVMKRLGLDYPTLSAENARLISLSLTGFGDDGPYADRPAYEHLLQALSGVMRQQGGNGPPTGIQSVVIDKSSAMIACNAILAALLHRERTGQGQRVSVSLMSAVAGFLLPELLSNDTFLADDAEHIPNGNTFFPVETADGHVVGYLQQRPHFEALCRTFGREDLIDDPRFKTTWDIFSQMGEIWAEMQSVARDFTTADIVARASSFGVPLAPVNTLRQFFDDPQVRHAGVFEYVEDAQMGMVRQIAYPAKLEKSPATIRTLAPRLGGDTDALLHAMGYSTDQTADFHRRGIVG